MLQVGGELRIKIQKCDPALPRSGWRDAEPSLRSGLSPGAAPWRDARPHGRWTIGSTTGRHDEGALDGAGIGDEDACNCRRARRARPPRGTGDPTLKIRGTTFSRIASAFVRLQAIGTRLGEPGPRGDVRVPPAQAVGGKYRGVRRIADMPDGQLRFVYLRAEKLCIIRQKQRPERERHHV